MMIKMLLQYFILGPEALQSRLVIAIPFAMRRFPVFERMRLHEADSWFQPCPREQRRG